MFSHTTTISFGKFNSTFSSVSTFKTYIDSFADDSVKETQ